MPWLVRELSEDWEVDDVRSCALVRSYDPDEEFEVLEPQCKSNKHRAPLKTIAFLLCVAVGILLLQTRVGNPFWASAIRGLAAVRGLAENDTSRTESSTSWMENGTLENRSGTTQLGGNGTLLVEHGPCGHVEHNMEFHTSEALRRVDMIFSVDMCCAACAADPECRAWEWGKRRRVMGLTDTCYLRKVLDGEKIKRVRRPGLVSGILLHRLEKHGIVEAIMTDGSLQAMEPHMKPSESCPGQVPLTGYGMVSVVGAAWHAPKEPGSRVDVAAGAAGEFVAPHLLGRAYFADRCSAGNYHAGDYVALQLLGRTLRYTVDLSEAGCGCVAMLHLTPMRFNTEASKCKDYFCGPEQGGICGVLCPTLRLQDANKFAWSTSLHVTDDPHGINLGYGGFERLVGRRDWNASEYGPGSQCIDTSWPIDVSLHFPVDDEGMLKAVELTLSQEGHSCKLVRRMENYTFKGRDSLAEISAVLDQGVTPVLSYWSSSHLRWLDGLGMDGQGPCATDVPQACPRTVRFSRFVVDWRREDPRRGTPLTAALFAMQRRTARNAEAMQVGSETTAGAISVGLIGCTEGCSGTNISWMRGGDGVDEEAQDSMPESTGDSSEWEVISDHTVPIRKLPFLTSTILFYSYPGEILIGKRAGNWVQLLRQPGFVLIHHGMDQIFLQRRVVIYKRLTMGSCSESGMFAITNVKTCQAASFALGYFDTFVNVHHSKSDKPYGCYLLDGQLFLVTNEANMENSVGNRTLLCVSSPYPTTTTTTTATNTTSTMLSETVPSMSASGQGGPGPGQGDQGMWWAQHGPQR